MFPILEVWTGIVDRYLFGLVGFCFVSGGIEEVFAARPKG